MADAIRRSDVWLVDLGEPVGHEAAYLRPALVVSDDPANRYDLVTVAPIGRARRDFPTRVEIGPDTSGLDEVSYVQAEQLHTISTNRLVRRVGRADLLVMHEVERVLRLLLRL